MGRTGRPKGRRGQRSFKSYPETRNPMAIYFLCKSIVKDYLKTFCTEDKGIGGIEKRYLQVMNQDHLKEFASNYYDNLRKALMKAGDLMIEVTAVTRGRLLIGAGLPLETLGIFLEFPHGLPVIPGSSLKGVVRSVMDEGCLKDFKDFQELIFGSVGEEGGSGRFIFVGGFPVNSNSKGKVLELDVLSPHYRNYYASKGAVGDSEKGIEAFEDDVKPVIYVVVGEGVTYKFLIVVKSMRDLKMRVICKFIKELKRALEVHGIGYGISRGYGIFSVEEVKVYDDKGNLLYRTY